MDKHRATHRLLREFALPEPKGWTEVPQLKEIQGKEDVQEIISPLQVDAETDSGLLTDSLST